MAFDRADIRRWATFCSLGLTRHATDAQIRNMAYEVSKKADLPPGHGRGSPYLAMIEAGKAVRTADARRRFAEKASEVGEDLVASCRNQPDLIEGLIADLKRSRVSAPQDQVKTPAVKTHVANHHAFDRFSARRDLHDAEEIAAREVEPDDLPLPYAQRLALARIANDSDEAAETERAFDYLTAPP